MKARFDGISIGLVCLVLGACETEPTEPEMPEGARIPVWVIADYPDPSFVVLVNQDSAGTVTERIGPRRGCFDLFDAQYADAAAYFSAFVGDSYTIEAHHAGGTREVIQTFHMTEAVWRRQACAVVYVPAP